MKPTPYSAAVIVSCLLLFGCTITREAELRDARIKGPINPPPLRVTNGQKAGDLILSSHISLNLNNNLDGNVEVGNNISSGTSYQDPAVSVTRKENLHWEASKFSGGFDLDICVSNHFAFSGSINLSGGGSSTFLGGTVGIGLFSETNNSGVRLDAGLGFSSLSYDVHSTVVERIDSWFEPSRENIYYFHDQGESSSKDFYATLTLNSANHEDFASFYLSLGYFGQTILDYNPLGIDGDYYVVLLLPLPVEIRNETQLTSNAGFMQLHPGLFFNLAPNMRLAAGARVLFATGIESIKNLITLPYIQFDFVL